jgi:hypothetical protein
MTDADRLRGAFVSLEVNADCTEAVLRLSDGSRLHFRHRVGQRQAAATSDDSDAGRVLERIGQFRLNRRHLDVRFADGSCWEALFGDAGRDHG